MLAFNLKRLTSSRSLFANLWLQFSLARFQGSLLDPLVYRTLLFSCHSLTCVTPVFLRGSNTGLMSQLTLLGDLLRIGERPLSVDFRFLFVLTRLDSVRLTFDYRLWAFLFSVQTLIASEVLSQNLPEVFAPSSIIWKQSLFHKSVPKRIFNDIFRSQVCPRWKAILYLQWPDYRL